MKTELNIQDVKADAKAMKIRLNELGVDIGQSQLLEALAAAYEFKNWHVMNQKRKELSQSAVAVVDNTIQVKTEISLFVECYNTDEYAAQTLAWVQIKLTQEFVNTLVKHQKIAEDNNITVRLEEFPWDMGDAHSASAICHSTLVITPYGSFWFEMSSKHEHGHNEFGSISIEYITRLVASMNLVQEEFLYYEVDSSHFTAEQPYLLMFRGDSESLTEKLSEAGILKQTEES